VCLRGHGTNLIGAVTLALWGTPRVTTNGGWGTPEAPDKSRLENQVLAGSSGSSTAKARRGALNPEFVCWLMGYPVGWLFAAPLNAPARRTKKNTRTAESER
jgi:hypothetical protein